MPKVQAAAQIIQAGVDTGVLVNDIISTYYQLKAAKGSEEKAYKWAQVLRQDALAQQAINNMYKEIELALAKNNASFEKYKWGQMFKLTKQQYADQKAQLDRQLTRQRSLDVMGGAFDALNKLNQQYNAAALRMGE